MRTSAVSSIFTARRVASTIVLPGVFAGMLVFAAPASAQTTPTTGICNGVTNQLAHRGSVQSNLLKAAAKKNADIILKLEGERTVLRAQASTLEEVAREIQQVLNRHGVTVQWAGAPQ